MKGELVAALGSSFLWVHPCFLKIPKRALVSMVLLHKYLSSSEQNESMTIAGQFLLALRVFDDYSQNSEL